MNRRLTLGHVDALVIALVGGGLCLAGMANSEPMAPMYQTEAQQAGYADDYSHGATGCEGADDPAETVLGSSYAQLADAGCVSIFEL